MNEPLFWSDAMNAVFRDEVVRPVCDHPDTDFADDVDTLFGVPFLVVRDEVIAKGRADFGIGYEHPTHGRLTADQKVLLYSFINFKKHFYACRKTFETYRSTLTHLWGGEKPTVVDLGCGPGTAGLALCDSFPGSVWDYLGVDTAPPMLHQADRMFAAARRMGLYAQEGKTRWCSSWSECRPPLMDPSAPVLIVCSYLFASASLDTAALRDLAGWLHSVRADAKRTVALLVYLNSTNPYANTNDEYFKVLVGLDPMAHRPSPDTVRFLKNRNGTKTGSDEFLHELLMLKGG